MKRIALTTLVLFSFLGGCTKVESQNASENVPMTVKKENLEKATFAGGCFWCMEHPFEDINAVVEVVSGYTGGQKKNPTYEEVSYGNTGHTEAVQISYDPDKITYEELLDLFWRQFDPTDAGGSFGDRGSQYRSAIFYHNDEQKRLAETSKEKMNQSKIFDKPIVTEITKLEIFYKAEDYHQDYYKKNPVRYKMYRFGSGRDRFLKKIWGSNMEKKSNFKKASQENRRKKLTPLQYEVTQKNGTERPFNNEYWNNKKEGIYVDIVSGEPLFSSKDKFESGTGWPSFTRPLEPENIVEKKDRSLFMVRTEVRSKLSNSHLGHLFDDGPQPTGLRYCINSASLRFIPKEKLESEEFEKYKELF